jgi:hypothetical protein
LITYRVRLDVPRELVLFVSRLLAERRRQIGTRKGTRSLGCYRQALFVLAWFRDNGDIPRLGADFGLSQATSYRYVDQVIEVLEARAPGLREALERALAAGTPYVLLDGKIVDSDRCGEKTLSRKGAEIDLWYSGKKHDFGIWSRPAGASGLNDATGRGCQLRDQVRAMALPSLAGTTVAPASSALIVRARAFRAWLEPLIPSLRRARLATGLPARASLLAARRLADARRA